MERYVFDLSTFPNVPFEGGYGDLLLQQLAEVGGGAGEEKKRLDEITIAGLEAQFRACLMKLSVAAPDLGRLPEDCTYTVAVEMKEPGAPINVGFPPPPTVGDKLFLVFFSSFFADTRKVRRSLGSRRRAGQ